MTVATFIIPVTGGETEAQRGLGNLSKEDQTLRLLPKERAHLTLYSLSQ